MEVVARIGADAAQHLERALALQAAHQRLVGKDVAMLHVHDRLEGHREACGVERRGDGVARGRVVGGQN